MFGGSDRSGVDEVFKLTDHPIPALVLTIPEREIVGGNPVEALTETQADVHGDDAVRVDEIHAGVACFEGALEAEGWVVDGEVEGWVYGAGVEEGFGCVV
ncbi:hypothetical protein M7I_2920 [Glarea lozoyensis 74030]|uniref:Uncharacterized protein n=1 Tax=Glarea lozoyensis (strain ATCC 74030 / MF5533) TaxID=1104152 RepID=H0EK31_GLAL7|nr:hypothetical protein M7I_2920 [Glarea lozoyensis 74030]